jgi:hypothetical protein
MMSGSLLKVFSFFQLKLRGKLMSSVNIVTVTVAQHAELMSKFPGSWHKKLQSYTGEELFYFYKLCCMTPTFTKVKDKTTGEWVKVGTRDMFFLGLRSKFYRYMKGQVPYPIKGEAWIKLHHRFRYAFEAYCGIDEGEDFDVQGAKISYAKEQAKLHRLDVVKASELLAGKFKRYA